ncbi:MAG: hypothetical protein OHK0038_01080 [Flammeovirgaceae bacterium]
MKNLSKKFACVSLAVMTLLSSSCSTILQGSRQSIIVQSLTPDAKIIVDGNEMGKDAVTTKLKRNQSHTILVKKEGFETKTVTLDKNLQPGYVIADAALAITGFMFILPLLFLIVDAATGSWNKFEPEKVVVELEPKK